MSGRTCNSGESKRIVASNLGFKHISNHEKNKLPAGFSFEKYFFISLLKHLKDLYGFQLYDK